MPNKDRATRVRQVAQHAPFEIIGMQSGGNWIIRAVQCCPSPVRDEIPKGPLTGFEPVVPRESWRAPVCLMNPCTVEFQQLRRMGGSGYSMRRGRLKSRAVKYASS